ncbi:MAG: 50S ribosomal protein L28 [Clostridia bacterium]|nr:50S ribosomal protein L28 [Clostridia bacterium]
MAKCAVCGKTTSFGNNLSITRSHISKRNVRPVKPNLRTVKANINGESKRIKVCAKCLRDGKIERA